MKSSYLYLSEQQQRVMELCALVFSDPNFKYISPSRRIKLKKIHSTKWGFWATFYDGRTYRVPINSGLDLGKDYYCSHRINSEICIERNDSDYSCKMK